MAMYRLRLLPCLAHQRVTGSGIQSSGSSNRRNWKVFGSSEQKGDKDAQEVLVEILRLQKGQVEVDEFVKERSQYLKEVAEGANEEYQRIADDVEKGMDEINSKIMESVEAEVGELEREMAISRAQIEADEREFEEYEKKIVNARNDGLFFKSLFQPLKRSKVSQDPEQKLEMKAEASKAAETAKKEASSSSRQRRAVYAALGILLTLTIVEAVVSGEDWYKVGIYSVLLLGLLLQFGYESFFKKS